MMCDLNCSISVVLYSQYGHLVIEAFLPLVELSTGVDEDEPEGTAFSTSNENERPSDRIVFSQHSLADLSVWMVDFLSFSSEFPGFILLNIWKISVL